MNMIFEFVVKLREVLLIVGKDAKIRGFHKYLYLRNTPVKAARADSMKIYPIRIRKFGSGRRIRKSAPA